MRAHALSARELPLNLVKANPLPSEAGLEMRDIGGSLRSDIAVRDL